MAEPIRTYSRHDGSLALVVLVVFVAFMVQNRVTTTVEFLLFEVSGPLWLSLLVTFLFGGAVAWLLFDRPLRERCQRSWAVSRSRTS